ncbi:acyl-CoA thioesterase [Peribacillus butanolivorans]|uniref:acyl-CoA thioesterase n=1 Tax=Peribacillus butanolivorans TaxID=421767 RepID=UPI0036610B3C
MCVIIPEIDIYVRYCETDASGHVNNVSYFIYLEEARTRFFQAIGLSKEKRGNVKFVVASAKCDFLAQAYSFQTLTVTTRVSRIGTKSFTLEHTIKDAETGKIIASGSAVIVCFNFQRQQSENIPLPFRVALEKVLVSV